MTQSLLFPSLRLTTAPPLDESSTPGTPETPGSPAASFRREAPPEAVPAAAPDAAPRPNKQQMIEDIRRHNRTASTEFLIRFDEPTLAQYLNRLTRVLNHRGQSTRWVRQTASPAVTTRARNL